MSLWVYERIVLGLLLQNTILVATVEETVTIPHSDAQGPCCRHPSSIARPPTSLRTRNRATARHFKGTLLPLVGPDASALLNAVSPIDCNYDLIIQTQPDRQETVLINKGRGLIPNRDSVWGFHAHISRIDTAIGKTPSRTSG